MFKFYMTSYCLKSEFSYSISRATKLINFTDDGRSESSLSLIGFIYNLFTETK